MKAITITGTGGPEVLQIRETQAPEPRGEQVRVRVRACGLNRADLMQCRGYYPAPREHRPIFLDLNTPARSMRWDRTWSARLNRATAYSESLPAVDRPSMW